MYDEFMTKERNELISDYIIKRAALEKDAGYPGAIAKLFGSAALMVPALSFGLPMVAGYGYHSLNRKAQMSKLIGDRRKKALEDKIKELHDEGF
jgi:hypothetical protein